ncbi:MAG: M20/M25/M40 family metallo-hydrolase, partial [Oscillospiraceae bacterium]|nr:M20/M25/M40 family metallo-hydrolase [Oscillospiraceae bacterium]
MAYIILGFVLLFFVILFVRAALFNPPKTIDIPAEDVSFDKEAAVDALTQLVRCKTVSYADHSLEDDGEFEKLIALLPTLYPNVTASCPMLRLPDRALLFHWKGKDDGDPAVLMAHYDVVPVEEEKWEKPAFEAIIEDGVMWGRGTLDTKVTFNGILSAAENLLKEGFTPDHDIYFAFSGGEEVNGKGAVHIVDWFAEHQITPALVLDEGAA